MRPAAGLPASCHEKMGVPCVACRLTGNRPVLRPPGYAGHASPSLRCGEAWWEQLESHQHLLGFNEPCRLTTLRSRENWHGRQVMLLHRAVLETAAFLVGHVRRVRAVEKLVEDGGISPPTAACEAVVIMFHQSPESWTRVPESHRRRAVLRTAGFRLRQGFGEITR